MPNDLITQALRHLQPAHGHNPDQQQLTIADVYAKAANAQALDRIATALEQLAKNTAL